MILFFSKKQLLESFEEEAVKAFSLVVSKRLEEVNLKMQQQIKNW